MNRTPPAGQAGDLRAGLAGALTFHASFDHGINADFALGDKQLYTAEVSTESEVSIVAEGISDSSMSIAPGAGKYGDALAFKSAVSNILVYKAEKNIDYSHEGFRGTASLWMSLDPAEIPGQYTDPLQFSDKNYSDDCIWIDFTKNDTPSDFRLGIFGDRGEWDVQGLRSKSPEFFWRLAKIAEPPFAKDRWTHVVVTWDGLNDSQSGRARLYFNGEYQGASGVIREHFNWDVSKATIRLGTGPFIGLMDDLAFFNRALTHEEIRTLYGLKGGVAELHA